jgi:hypothetical protein
VTHELGRLRRCIWLLGLILLVPAPGCDERGNGDSMDIGPAVRSDASSKDARSDVSADVQLSDGGDDFDGDAAVLSDASLADSASDSSGDSEPSDSRLVSFAEIQAIFDSHCVVCHDASHTGAPNYPAMPLTAGASYGAIFNTPAKETCGGDSGVGVLHRVVPGNPESSYLWHKVSEQTPCKGMRMPRATSDAAPAEPLGETELFTIQTWIQQGALP